MSKNTLMYPVEIVTLPSQGKYYPSGHPLRENGGKLELKYMTAKEEDILTNTNLITNGTVVDTLLKSLVIHEGVKYTDLTLGDLEAALIASRVLAYGKDYPIEVQCGKCSEITEQIVDLTTLESPDDLIEVDDNGHHTFTTETGLEITIKTMTRGDEIQVERNIKVLKNKFANQPTPEVTARLKNIIVSINGETDKNVLSTMIDNLIVKDTKQLRDELNKINPAVDMTIETVCSKCGHMIKGGIPIGINFLWPDSTI